MELADDTYASLKAAHGSVRAFGGGDDEESWTIVLRKPNGKEAMAFRLGANNPSRKAFVALDMVKATVVWPEKAAFDKILDSFPFMPEGICGDDSDGSWQAWTGQKQRDAQKK